ncbi:MAG: hypothetical protein ABJC13_06495 [Acidobacteriota bacterium]
MKISRLAPHSALLVLAMIATVAAPGFGQGAPDKSWSFTAGVDRSSLYLFRGSDLLDGEKVLTPYVVLGVGNLSLYSYGYAGKIPGGDYREIDLGAEYAIPLGSATLTLGGVSYQYNKDAEQILVFLDTYEVYGSLGFGGPLSPKISYWYDNDKVKGGYGTVGISHSFPLGAKSSLDFTGSVGWDFGYNNKAVSDGTLNDALVGINVPLQIRDNLTIHGSVQRSIALDSLDKRREADPSLTGTSEDEMIVTFGASLTF